MRMEFARLLEIIGDDPLFDTGLLLAGDVDPQPHPQAVDALDESWAYFAAETGALCPCTALSKGKTAPILCRKPNGAWFLCELPIGTGLLWSHP